MNRTITTGWQWEKFKHLETWSFREKSSMFLLWETRVEKPRFIYFFSSFMLTTFQARESANQVLIGCKYKAWKKRRLIRKKTEYIKREVKKREILQGYRTYTVRFEFSRYLKKLVTSNKIYGEIKRIFLLWYIFSIHNDLKQNKKPKA